MARSLRSIFEDALRIKVKPKDNEYSGISITKDKDDLADKQIRSSGSGSLIDTEAITKFRTLSSDRSERYYEFENLLKDYKWNEQYLTRIDCNLLLRRLKSIT